MNSYKIKRIILPLAALLAALNVGCDRQGPAERAGERMDRAVDRTGDSLERAGDRARERTER